MSAYDVPVVSAVIVTYGSSQMLYETIDSILMQKQDGIELIVSDDGSGRFDAEAVRAYIEARKNTNIVAYAVHGYEKNVGTVRNLNRAIREAKGRYIKLIAGDDAYYDESVFARQAAYLDAHPEAWLVTGKVQQCDENMNPVEDRRTDETNALLKTLFEMPPEEAFALYLHKGYSPLVTQAACFRKRFFEEYGYYDESFRLIEDSPMGARIILQGIKVGFQDEFSVKHRQFVGMSSTAAVFSTKRIGYYKDVVTYAEKWMLPHKKLLGSLFVRMRYRISKYRYDMCVLKSENGSRVAQCLLSVKYADALLYYMLNTPMKAIDKIKNLIGKKA